jgi:predicted phosphodiesterase
MKFRIISDIHLEFQTGNKFVKQFLEISENNKVESLIMAGDITTFEGLKNGSFESFINTIRPAYKNIIYVLGNHEYYYYTESTNSDSNSNNIQNLVLIEFKKFCIQKGIILLENEIIELSGGDSEKVTIGGTTLWSPISKYSTLDTNKDSFLSYETIRNMNNKALEWIIENKTPLNILITHHLPSYEFIDSKYKHTDNSGFANSDLDYMFVDLQIGTWIFGHTHTPIRSILDGIEFICNPYGYPDENPHFKSDDTGNYYDLVIDI